MTTRRRIVTSLAAALITIGCGVGIPAAAGPAVVLAPQGPAEAPASLPNKSGSLKFVVLGDFGTGERRQYDLAAELAKFHEGFKFDTVVTVGDNLIWSQQPADFKRKFEDPYKPLLDAGVKFHAVLGNHDVREQKNYALFNMGGKLYYSFKPPSQKVRFFMLDSGYPVPEQIDWLEKELKGSSDDWKIAAFHHPLYSSGGRHGSDRPLREVLEPLFVQYDVSVTFAGHDHFYERIKPQKGIVHFIVGSGGRLAVGDIDKSSPLMAKGFDTGCAFLAVEITGDELYFNAISSTGQVVDSGLIQHRPGSRSRDAR